MLSEPEEPLMSEVIRPSGVDAHVSSTSRTRDYLLPVAVYLLQPLQ